MPASASKTPDTAPLTADPLDYELLLRQILEQLKTKVFDPDTPPRDLASLSRRTLEVCRELNRLENVDGGEAQVMEVEDEEIDPTDI